MPLSTEDKLRLLNLAYHQMQSDFKKFAPDLFRGDEQSLTSTAGGYILLSLVSFEVEQIYVSATQMPLEPIPKALKYRATGWYHDGIDTATGKRRIMVRNGGAAYASTLFKVDTLVEYPSLAALTDTPHPFAQERYLNMLTELQAFMMHMEGGKEMAKEAEKHWNVYQFLLKEARKDMLKKLPEFISHSHSDAGDIHSLPYVR